MLNKSLSSLNVKEAKSLDSLYDENEKFIIIPKNDLKDENIPLVYECILLNLKRLEEQLKDGVRERFEEFTENLYDLPLPLSAKTKDILVEIQKAPFIQKTYLHTVFLKELLVHVNKNQKELTNLLCECYLTTSPFLDFKKKITNPIDFDIILLVILKTNSLATYFLDKSQEIENTTKIKRLLNELTPLYQRLNILERLQPTSTLFVEGYLDYFNNYDNLDVRVGLTNETIKTIFKFINSAVRPHYEVIDSIVKLDDVILPVDTMEHIRSLCEQHKRLSKNNIKNRLTFLFKGAPGTGKTYCAQAVANFLGLKLINVNLNEHSADKNLPTKVLGLMRRAEAKNCVLLFDECESVLGQNPFNGTSDSWAKKVFESFNGVAIFTTNYVVPYGFDRRVNYVVELKHPDVKARALILHKECKKLVELNVLAKAPAFEILQQIAKDYTVSGGYYSQILKLAASLSNPPDQIDPVKLRLAFDHVSQNLNTKVAHNNDEVRITKIKLADVKLPVLLKEETSNFINYAKEIINKKVTHPLLPKGATAIFSGLPGTGKTILAEAIANELNMEFRRCSPSTFLSKWVGESEERIKKVFKEAEKEKYLLFIDEAEGIFLDRKGADSSWEKTIVDELLQQLEDFKGVLIVATNFKDMIDEAFARRFVFHFAFEIPDFATRKELWGTWKKEFGLSEEDIISLAQKYELTGGEIRNVCVQHKIRGGALGISSLHKISDLALSSRTGKVKRKLGLN